MTSNMWLSPSRLALLMSNMNKISASWRCPGHHWFRDRPNEAKWVKMECLLLCFLHVLTALFSMTASLITLKLLSATREAFALPVDSSQEVVLHMSPFKQLRECPFIPFLRFYFWPTLTVWHRLLKSLFLSQFLDGQLTDMHCSIVSNRPDVMEDDLQSRLLEASGVHETGSWLKVLGGDKRWREKTAERQHR